MHAPPHEYPAAKPAGPGRPAKQSGSAKYVLRNPPSLSQYVHVTAYVPCRNKRNAVPNQDKRAYTGIMTRMYSEHTSTYHCIMMNPTRNYVQAHVGTTGYILLTSRLYFKTYM